MSVTRTTGVVLAALAAVILASVACGLAGNERRSPTTVGNPASKKAAAETKPANTADAEMLKTLGISPAYLDRKIKHISNAELCGAIDLTRPGLEEVRKSVKARDYKAAYRAWGAYWAKTHQVKPPAPQKPPGKRLLDRAAAIMRHEITGWGDVTIKHGPVVDFNANYGNSGKYGFHYWFWSRTLLNAYRATGDEKYLACFDKLFNQWYEQRDRVTNPFPAVSVVWYELGCGLRTVSFTNFYRLPFPAQTPLTHERMLKTLLGSARWLLAREKTGFRKGNWQVTGSFGLANIGLAVPEFVEAQTWVRLGAGRIAEHAERDFFKDGGHSERCPSSYMFGVYDGLAKTDGILKGKYADAEMTSRIAATMERAAEFWMYVTTPEGHLSAINDGARVVFSPKTLTEAGRRYNRKDFLFVAKNLLGGKVGEQVSPPKHTSINFPDSCFAVLRSDWTPRARYMLLNYGPCTWGHAHPSILDFEISAFGRAMAIDAGIGGTYDDPLHKVWYKTSRAHNMLVVDDEQINPAVAHSRDVVWESETGLDFFAATTRGWEKGAKTPRLIKGKGVVWRRCVAFVKPDYWIIYDVARTAKAGHTLSWYLHSPTDLVAKNGGYASAKAPGLIVRPIGQTFKTRRGKGRASVGGLGFKKAYRDIDWVAFDAPSRKAGRVTFPMLLYPYEKSPPKVSLRVVAESDEGAHFVIRVDRKTDHVVFSLGQKGFRDKQISTDGYCAVVRCRDGKVVSWSVAGGRKLTFPGLSGQSVTAPTAPSKDSFRKTTNEGSDKTE
ncbi:MAG: alginate lyase family protein [Phycisphaerae bacterium]|nr:alginate lyase family protein [Phycisphaerae bacterium]